jgi:hypothetical protein
LFLKKIEVLLVQKRRCTMLKHTFTKNSGCVIAIPIYIYRGHILWEWYIYMRMWEWISTIRLKWGVEIKSFFNVSFSLNHKLLNFSFYSLLPWIILSHLMPPLDHCCYYHLQICNQFINYKPLNPMEIKT